MIYIYSRYYSILTTTRLAFMFLLDQLVMCFYNELPSNIKCYLLCTIWSSLARRDMNQWGWQICWHFFLQGRYLVMTVYNDEINDIQCYILYFSPIFQPIGETNQDFWPRCYHLRSYWANELWQFKLVL